MAVTVAFCFESFINTFGYPDIILTDQGRNLEKRPYQGNVRSLENRQEDYISLPPSVQGPERTIQSNDKCDARPVRVRQPEGLGRGSPVYCLPTERLSTTQQVFLPTSSCSVANLNNQSTFSYRYPLHSLQQPVQFATFRLSNKPWTQFKKKRIKTSEPHSRYRSTTTIVE